MGHPSRDQGWLRRSLAVTSYHRAPVGAWRSGAPARMGSCQLSPTVGACAPFNVLHSIYFRKTIYGHLPQRAQAHLNYVPASSV